MADLLQAQQRLWTLVANGSQKPPMLRLSRQNDCCWICDLPRHVSDCGFVQRQLIETGFVILPNQEDDLWHIDPVWQLDASSQLPSFPKNEALHSAYALLRLLLQHPCKPDAEQPMELVRAIVKQCCRPMAQPAAFITLHEQCAQLLRDGSVLPTFAIPYLRTYLDKEEL